MFSPIRGEIAEIIDKQTIVLNIGAAAGVKKAMRFVIYAEAGHIYDYHEKDLGVLEIPKAEVEVVDVQEQLSVATNVATRKIETGPLAYSSVDFLRRTATVTEDLPVKPEEIKKIELDRIIKKGDKVRQIL